MTAEASSSKNSIVISEVEVLDANNNSGEMANTTNLLRQQKRPAAVPARRKKGKKRKVSKHIADAAAAAAAVASNKSEEGEQSNTETGTKTKKKKKEKKKKHVKDPMEAAAYLDAWKHHSDNHTSKWKFSKNMQSWLIRHMYEPDKVPKPVFGLLVEYLDQPLTTTALVSRVVQDATRRALRYQEYEKAKRTTKVSPEQETNNDNNTSGGGNPGVSDEVDEDSERWKRLNDHDKRKEYKRARKLLESLSKTAAAAATEDPTDV